MSLPSSSPLPVSPRFEIIDLRELFAPSELRDSANAAILLAPYGLVDNAADSGSGAIVSRHTTRDAAEQASR